MLQISTYMPAYTVIKKIRIYKYRDIDSGIEMIMIKEN